MSRSQANTLLLLCAIIWGFGFIAQRVAGTAFPPILFNSLRFLLGAGLVSIVTGVTNRQWRVWQMWQDATLWRMALVAGTILSIGAVLQHLGVIYTSASKSAMITAFYAPLVPILGLWVGHRPHGLAWVGSVFSVLGLALISIQENLHFEWGDILLIIGAFVWAIHVLWLSHATTQTDPLKLAGTQYLVTGLLCGAVSLLWEKPLWQDVTQNVAPLLYSGLVSVGVGYTLQVVGQKHARPTETAIILSLEIVFATLGGWWLLHEILTARMLWGCAFMLLGMVIAQLQPETHQRPAPLSDCCDD
ncbi:MAG TPA: DMT family transporter [Anaerolineales bacterium]|nr:DMT family transporter [Anaerolineales bacterium]